MPFFRRKTKHLKNKRKKHPSNNLTNVPSYDKINIKVGVVKMKTNLKVSGIVVFGVLLSITLPHVITLSTEKHLEEKSQTNASEVLRGLSDSLTVAKNEKRDTAVPKEQVKVEEPVVEEPVQEPEHEPVVEVVKEETPAPSLDKSYDEMTTEELINAINTGAYKLEYTSEYNASPSKLSKPKGAIYYDGHKETYYSERVLPGTSLPIPGRHTADDGTVRDGDGYICLAANTSYLSKGTVVKTSMGPGKVYDTGCASGIVDIYTNW